MQVLVNDKVDFFCCNFQHLGCLCLDYSVKIMMIFKCDLVYFCSRYNKVLKSLSCICFFASGIVIED